MAKIFTYVVTMTGLLLLLTLGGISTTSNSLLQSISYGNLSGVASSPLVIAITAIFAISGIGVIAGLLTSQSAPAFIKASLCSLLLVWFVADMVGVLKLFGGIDGMSWAYYVILLLGLPLLVGYLIALVEWWEGTD